MCGIIGYFGKQNPKDVIFTGLKKLEYRGYDSAGVAILDRGKFRRLRAEGKLVNLQSKLKDEKFDGSIGIGHTRWATHGIPSERNAHPHNVGQTTIVHNGIIENYQEIRDALLKLGANIDSDTDSELIAHLVEEKMQTAKDLKIAVDEVIPHLRGAYSIVAVNEKEPENMVAFKNGPPLILGLGQNEVIVASDLQAILPYTNRVVFLEDLQVAYIRKNEVDVFSANGFPIEPEIQELDDSHESAEKHGFPHFMLKEIYEQPRVVAAAMDPHIDLEKLTISLKGFQEQELKNYERLFFIACGTSYYAALYGEYLIEKFAKLPVEVEFASEFRYREPVMPKNSLVIVISQSGETADTLAGLRLAKEQGADVLSICNVKNSSIDREAKYKLYMNADAEIGVASTKALTATMTILNLFALKLGRLRDKLSEAEEKDYLRSLQAMPSQIEKVLAYDKYFSQAADTLKEYRGFLYIGRGVSFPMALEGALKLKELAYMHAEGYAAGEMKHGPIALVDERMAIVVVAPEDDVYEKTLSNLEEVRARGGQIISIGTGKNEKLEKLSQHYLSLPKSSWNLNPILTVVPLQLMAYHVADSLGFDVDQPRNLAKSVTVE